MMLIALEGIDGSGKGTQARQLDNRLQQHGCSVARLSFPRYEETLFGQKIADYLNGRFGELSQVHPLLASLLFAGDRFESRLLLQEQRQTHDVVILDRYVASNIAHQAARVGGKEREELIEFIRRLEFGIYALPRPDITLLLDLPVEKATELIRRKAPRNYTAKTADLHEADAGYLNAVREVYRQLAATQPGWLTISAVQQGRLRSVEEIAEEIAGSILPRLPL